MALIEISNLEKEYRINEHKSQQVLKGLSFSMNRGEFIAIVGESGSGKSTLLNIIGGLDSDYKGSVKFEGKDCKFLSILIAQNININIYLYLLHKIFTII